MQKLVENYPKSFTGETVILPDLSLEQQAKSKDLLMELKSLTAPLVGWLRENYGPHTEIDITWDFVAVKHDGIGVPFSVTEK